MKLNALAGGALGLLFGLSMGLSASPIVSTILGALVGVVTVFLSLKTGDESKSSVAKGPEPEGGKTGPDPEVEKKLLYRLTAFAVAAIVGIFGGLIIRANNLLSTATARQEYRDFLAIGFSESEARSIVRTRLEKESVKAEDQKVKWSALFTGQATNLCGELDPDQFQTATDVISKYKISGEPWASAAEQVSSKVKPADQKKALKAFHTFFCALQG
jgi:hypothetical protein